MHVIFDERQLRHDPAEYFRRGAIVAHPEQPQRAVLLRDALAAAGHTILSPRDYGRVMIDAVHAPDYVDFLLSAWERWSLAAGSCVAAVPNYHPGRRLKRVPEGIFGQLGYYVADTGCPIVEGTAEAIYWSAQSAIDAATLVGTGEQPFTYALCRPPGHHAYRDQANGFCYFNNAAIAAECLRRHFMKVAIVDIDIHGGNGTQDIFYTRADVLFISIHVDPADFPPYYTGYSDETGSDDGMGTTLNLVLRPGATQDTILQQIEYAAGTCKSFGAEALVVSLGFDMSKDDPLSQVDMAETGFQKAAGILSRLDLPTVLVQEGGYLGPSLANNGVTFLQAFEEARHQRG